MKITHTKYAEALTEVLADGGDAKTAVNNLLLMLRKRKQFRLLPKILQSFEEQWAKKNGILKIEATYPVKLPGSVDELKTVLEHKLGKKVVMKNVPSATMIGGFRVLAGDTLIDASMEGRLKALERKLKS